MRWGWIVLLVGSLSFMGGLVSCGADGGSSSTDDGPREAYPSGPYGTAEGAVMEPLDFIDSTESSFSFEDIYLDDSNKVLLLSTSAGWCAACIEEQPKLKTMYNTYRSQGLSIVIVMAEDSNFNIADAALAQSWKERHELPFPVIADTQSHLADFYGQDAMPTNMLLDVSTMEIIKIQTGLDQSVFEAIIEARL